MSQTAYEFAESLAEEAAGCFPDVADLIPPEEVNDHKVSFVVVTSYGTLYKVTVKDVTHGDDDED